MRSLVFGVLLLTLSACTDAAWDAYVASYGESTDVACYSGGKQVFLATTTGKVASLTGGGWAFRTMDGDFVQTFADCFVSFKK